MIIPFPTDEGIALPANSVLSFDVDGTLTKWVPDARGYHEEGFQPVIDRLKLWVSLGFRSVITTHRTKELEGNPAFMNHGRDKMTIDELIRRYQLPVHDVLFTHMGDKGEFLRNYGNVFAHYDDEQGNLESVSRAGIYGVRVNTGFEPPKVHVAGDGCK